MGEIKFIECPELVEAIKTNFHFDCVAVESPIPLIDEKPLPIKSWLLGTVDFDAIDALVLFHGFNENAAIAELVIMYLKDHESQKNVPWNENTKTMYALSVVVDKIIYPDRTIGMNGEIIYNQTGDAFKPKLSIKLRSEFV